MSTPLPGSPPSGSGDRIRLLVIAVCGGIIGLCGFLAIRWTIG